MLEIKGLQLLPWKIRSNLLFFAANSQNLIARNLGLVKKQLPNLRLRDRKGVSTNNTDFLAITKPRELWRSLRLGSYFFTSPNM